MVILSDHVFLAADVKAGQQFLELATKISGFREGRLLVLRRLPYGLELELGHPVVDEIHVQVGHGPAVIEAVVFPGISEGAKHRGLDPHLLGKRHELVQLVRGDCHGHPFLGL